MGQTSSTQSFVFQSQEEVFIPPSPQPQQPQRKCFKAAKKPTTTNHQNPPQGTSKIPSEKASIIERSLSMKNLGNNYILNKQYDKAIDCYTQAIKIYPGDSIYYSNRAVANKQLNRLSEAKADAQSAIKLDEKNARAHFVNGTIILMEVQKCQEISEQLIKQSHLGLQSLDKAYQYIKDNTDEQKCKLKVLINQNLGKGRRMVFLLAQEMDRRSKISFNVDISALKSLLASIAARNKKKLDFEYIDQQMNKKILQDIPVPAYFQCIMTYEIMNEPILFNTGLTYERRSIEQQFKSNGFVDPITRAEIDPQTARLNIQLLQGINQLRQKYGWIGIEHENDYKAIKFE